MMDVMLGLSSCSVGGEVSAAMLSLDTPNDEGGDLIANEK
jgi:hypothetical protein